MIKPFAILQSGESLSGPGIYDPETGEVTVQVRRNDGSVTEETGALGQCIISYSIEANGCNLSVGSTPDSSEDAIVIRATTTRGWR